MLEEKTRYHFDNTYMDDPLKFDGINLIQIGRRYCAPGEVIGSHVHVDWFELTVITGGSGTVTTDGHPMKVRTGDVYFSYPADIHNILADNGEKLEYDYYAFGTRDSAIKSKLDYITQYFRSADARILHDDKIPTLLGYALN